jgi:hypothetical protein
MDSAEWTDYQSWGNLEIRSAKLKKLIRCLLFLFQNKSVYNRVQEILVELDLLSGNKETLLQKVEEFIKQCNSELEKSADELSFRLQEVKEYRRLLYSENRSRNHQLLLRYVGY